MGSGLLEFDSRSAETIMSLSSCTRETFDDSDTRHDEMHSTIETWLEDLVEEVDDAVSSEHFRE